jgi:hemerythrin-like domain-containing protein
MTELIHNLDRTFNDLTNIIENIRNGYGGNYSNSPLRPLMGALWSKKISDLNELHEIEDFEIDKYIEEELDIDESETTTETREKYDTYIQKLSRAKRLLQEQSNDRIVPLKNLIDKIQEYINLNNKRIEGIEKILYKIKVGTLEGLTRDIIAKEKIKPEEGTLQESLLEQDYDEKAKLFQPKGGNRRSSRKYRKNKNKKNKTKKRRG